MTTTETETPAGTGTVFCDNPAHSQPVRAFARVRWPSGRFHPITACAVCLRDTVEDYVKGGIGERYSVLIDPIGPVAGYETPRPPIVCLCGSTRFREAFERAGRVRTLRGEIVLTVNDFDAYGGPERGQQDVPPGEKTLADMLHRRKIDLADYCLIVSDGSGYFGESTSGEIRYAVEHGKPVRFDVPAAEVRAREAGLIR